MPCAQAASGGPALNRSSAVGSASGAPLDAACTQGRNGEPGLGRSSAVRSAAPGSSEPRRVRIAPYAQAESGEFALGRSSAERSALGVPIGAI